MEKKSGEGACIYVIYIYIRYNILYIHYIEREREREPDNDDMTSLLLCQHTSLWWCIRHLYICRQFQLLRWQVIKKHAHQEEHGPLRISYWSTPIDTKWSELHAAGDLSPRTCLHLCNKRDKACVQWGKLYMQMHVVYILVKSCNIW